ncbi:glycoside hydrolase family 97 protein [Saccharicrinis sp. 156]|uniref:glycoside hydrolase family 97 protein n=1 Tax=Saccharicrinis sp. 156 TaxID=3417574 RepID=UPI003D340475
MTHKLFYFIILLSSCYSVIAQSHTVQSPSGEIKIEVEVDDVLTYRVFFKGEEIVAKSEIAFSIDNGMTFGKDAKVRSIKTTKISKEIHPVVPRKFNLIKDEYNELQLDFKGGYSLLARAYDEGVAYRWVSDRTGSYTVMDETVTFNFKDDHSIWFPEEKQVYSHQEREYLHLKLSDVTSERFCSTGTLVVLENGIKVYISESDLVDYPGMFLRGSDKNPHALVGKFAGYPLEVLPKGDRNAKVIKHADFLAKTQGKRNFPWRVMVVAANDGDLILSELIYKLATPLQLDDTSWIKPGKVSWDWWNANNIYGVDFKAGINTETYKYYIDFASKYGLEYINLDEGWYQSGDVLNVIDAIDIQALVNYGKTRNVGLILWVTWKELDENLDAILQQFESWGIKGIKVDFMQRDDQWMVNFYHRVAQKAAAKHMLVSYHGAYKPTGMRRAYPNVITREGVMGMEQSKWGFDANPNNDLLLPFIRMVAGPMDYTPGAMKNATKHNFRPIGKEPMSSGTRCHQLAMYVVFESPLQMLADNPSNYHRETECMKFLSEVPTIWDDTKVLDAKLGEYIALARRSGEKWFVGAMTNWTEREMQLNFDFLPEGNYTLKIWQDGVNAHRYAADYKMKKQSVRKGDVLNIHLAPGGGWTAIITKN